MTSAPGLLEQRLDKWLVVVRVFKTRSLAASAIAERTVTVNGAVVTKNAQAVRPGDEVLVLVGGKRWRLLRVEALAERRGSAAEAARLFLELPPPPPPDPWEM